LKFFFNPKILTFIHVPASEDYFSSVFSQFDRRLKSDSRGGSGDDDDPILKTFFGLGLGLGRLDAPTNAHRQFFVQPKDESESGKFRDRF
jgi:hypothetical protein